MAFFGNDAVNRVNVHYAIQSLAQGAGGTLVVAFLLHAGVSIPMTFVWLAGMLAGRFVLRPLILPIGKRWGLKPLVIAGVLLNAVQFPTYAAVHGLGWPLLLNGALGAASSTLYWPSYHAYFASIGDAEHRGHQVGIRDAVSTVIGIVGPLIGAWLILTAGPFWMFGAVATVEAFSVLPLLAAPNVMPPREAPGAWRAAREGVRLFLLEGWQAACINFIWPVALFVSLGSSIGAFGGATALAALVGAILTAVFGRQIDRGGGRRTAVLACVVTMALSLTQAVAFGHLWLAVAANALGAVAAALISPAISTPLYNLSQASPCAFRYNIATEGAYDIAAGAGVLTAAATSALGGSLSFMLLTALPAIAGVFWMLWRYYGAHPSAGGFEIAPELALEPRAPP
ncbi:MAG: MFS transporter [Caulobacteraceae bacterium]